MWFHCLGSICLYEKTYKSARLLQNFYIHMLPDVINGQAHCLYVRYALKSFNLLEGNFADIFLLKVQLKQIELGMFALSKLGR